MSDSPAEPRSGARSIPIASLPLSRTTPIIQSTARRLARRLRLQPCDQDDLEQDLWLLLLRICSVAGDTGSPAAAASPEEPSLFSHLSTAAADSNTIEASMDPLHPHDAGASL